MQQHQLDRGSFSTATSYSTYGGGSIGGVNMGTQQRQQQGMGGPQMPTMTRTQQSAPMQGSQGSAGLNMGMVQDNGGGQTQHFMQQSMSAGGSRAAYGNGQGQSATGGSMQGQQVNGNGLSQQYQQSMRSSSDATVGLSMQRNIDGSLLYDSQSFPSLSGGGGSRFSGMPMQSMRDDDFTIQNEDFPALPGSSHGERNSQKHDISGITGSMIGPGQGQGHGPLGIDRMRDLTQESLQHQLLEQQQQQQQHQMLLSSQSQSQSMGPAVSRGNMAQQIAVGGNGGGSNTDNPAIQGGNNSMSNGGFLGIGGGGGMQVSHMGNSNNSNGSNSNGAVGTSGVVQNKEGGYGLSGLLDVIRMTDKDLNTLALGSDLTTFGLNLNSSDCLYSSFSSPFSDQPALSEPQYTTPGCYAMHPPSLKPDHLTKFQMETLFYLFYSMPKDLLQACAAQELYRRDWRYHGELRLWLKVRSQQDLMQGQPNVQFMYFDVSGWEARLFTSQYRGNIASGLLSEEEVRVKAPVHSQSATGQSGGS